MDEKNWLAEFQWKWSRQKKWIEKRRTNGRGKKIIKGENFEPIRKPNALNHIK